MENWINEWYWIEWVPSHSIPFLQIQTMECDSISFHSIPSLSTNPNIALRTLGLKKIKIKITIMGQPSKKEVSREQKSKGRKTKNHRT